MSRWEQYAGVATEALDNAKCICMRGGGRWYVVERDCPKCGDSAAKAQVVLDAVGPLIELAAYVKVVEWIDEKDTASACG